MATGKGKQLVDGSDGVKPLGSKQRLDVMSGLIHWQRRHLKRSSLTIERSLILGEQGSHQRRLASREHICRGLAVVLDHRAKQSIKSVICDQQILELVEAHDRHLSIDFMQDARDIEQLEKSATSLIGRRSWRTL